MANTPLVIPQLDNRFIDDRDRVWGDSYDWSFNRNLTQVKYLVIHHSVTSPYIKNSNDIIQRKKSWQEQVDEIASLHRIRGWAGIGYHFVITSDGIIAYVGDLGTGRANVLNHNDSVIGICLIGDFTKHLPTDIQINSAHDLCDFFLFHYPQLPNVNGWEDVIGHKDCIQIWNDTTATACPGTSWPVDMKNRIKDNIIYSPVPTDEQTPTESETPVPSPEDSPPVEPQPQPTDSGTTDINGTSGSTGRSEDIPSPDASGDSTIGSDSNVVVPSDSQAPQKYSLPHLIADILRFLKRLLGLK